MLTCRPQESVTWATSGPRATALRLCYGQPIGRRVQACAPEQTGFYSLTRLPQIIKVIHETRSISTDVYRCVHDLCRCALFLLPLLTSLNHSCFINVLVRAKRSIFFFLPVTKRPPIKSRRLHWLIRKKSLIVGSWMVKLGFIMHTMVWLKL